MDEPRADSDIRVLSGVVGWFIRSIFSEPHTQDAVTMLVKLIKKVLTLLWLRYNYIIGYCTNYKL